MPAHVVLVIRDPTVAKYLPDALAREGFSCRCATTIAQAADFLATGRRWAAIVVDRDLLTRRKVAELWEFKKAYPSIPLIALDSLGTDRGGEGTPPPFDAVVPKPFVLKPLLAALASHRRTAWS